jgi:ribosomal protein S18 acetylase RimI-like enzyme
VRIANALDPLAINAVRTRSWKAAYREILPATYLAQLGSLHVFGPATWVIEDRGEMAGYLATDDVHPESRGASKSVVEIVELYLDPAHWRRGLGTALLSAVTARLGARGVGELFLWVLEANAPARAFYEARGFTAGGERKQVRAGGGAMRAAICYRRSLVR